MSKMKSDDEIPSNEAWTQHTIAIEIDKDLKSKWHWRDKNQKKTLENLAKNIASRIDEKAPR